MPTFFFFESVNVEDSVEAGASFILSRRLISIGTGQHEMMKMRVHSRTDRTCSQVDGKGSQLNQTLDILNQSLADPEDGHEISFILS